MYKTNQVYGVSNEMIETYIEREDVDRLFIEGLEINKHIIVYGASKQGKTYLITKHLKASDYIKVDCSPQSTALDIYKSIIRQLDIEILESKETRDNINGDIKIGLKAKIRIPFLSSEGEAMASASKGREKQISYKIIDYNLNLAQDVSELLKEIKFSKRIVLENFHYLKIDVQHQLAIDLRILEDYKIIFIILGIW